MGNNRLRKADANYRSTRCYFLNKRGRKRRIESRVDRIKLATNRNGAGNSSPTLVQSKTCLRRCNCRGNSDFCTTLDAGFNWMDDGIWRKIWLQDYQQESIFEFASDTCHRPWYR